MKSQDTTPSCFYGYDGNGYGVGDRVETHPASDSWMRGDRYGEVTKCGWCKDVPVVYVKLDHSGRTLRFTPINLRRVPEA